MNKIKFNSINENKIQKIKLGMKIVLAVASAGAVALIPACATAANQPGSSEISTSQIEFIDDKENSEIEAQVEQKVEEKTLNIDIKSLEFSKQKVSVCNSEFQISKELEQEINNNIYNYGGDCSFIAINLNDGMAFGYNVDKAYQTASTIKVAVSLYGFKQMDSGNGSLEELKVYEERFRRDGSGVLKNQKSGTKHSLKDLFYYTINYSDNVAYYMIHDRFHNGGYNEYLKKLGCNNLYLNIGARWGFIDARSMALVWQEIYKYKDETEYGKYFFELLTNAEYNYMEQGMDHYESAHKSGWTPRETHDSGIVFAKDDYIVVTLNNANGNYSAKGQLLKISNCIEKVIDEYTLYKEHTIDKQKILVR